MSPTDVAHAHTSRESHAKIIRKNETTLHKRGRIVTLGNKLQKNGFISTNGSIFAAKSEKMKHTSIILYTTVIVTLAASTLLGRIYGTEFVENEIYHATWFFLMWTLTAIAATTTLVKSKIWKKSDFKCRSFILF